MLQGRARTARRSLWRRAIAVVGAVTGLVAGLVVGITPEPASALSGSEFSAGYIISDEQFYDGSAMTASQIQAFLDVRIGSCTNGQCLNVGVVDYPGRPQYVSSRTGRVVCEAVPGGTIRISELIYRAQVACGISAKVILVTLQKEQGLVTNRAPGTWALSHAMGMACPDTAPCDPSFAGLATQIVAGTAQLKCYKACNFAKQPGLQYIQYHPNSSCGGTNVLVSNYATAALYSYTPYQPDSWALANLGGTGRECSSYGNRNFWVFYNNWFGSPTGDGEGPGATAISQAWAAQGGKTGPWGNRVQYMDCRNGIECGHVFENVLVGWTPEGGIFTATGPVKDWAIQQGLDKVGYPVTNVVNVTANGGGFAQGFSRSLLDWGPFGPFAVIGATREEHARLGGVGGPTGWPTSSRSCIYAGSGCLQKFEHAYIAEVGGAAASLTDPTMTQYWENAGGAAGPIGLPMTALVPVSGPNGPGTMVGFQFALVANGPTGLYSMRGAMRTAHGAAGGVNASIGWPTGEQVCAPGTGCSQSFQKGFIFVGGGVTRTIANGPIAAYYQANGGTAGALGIPMTSSITVPASSNGGGVQVGFQGGLVESSAAGTFVLKGAIRDAHGGQGGVAGPLGWPTGEQVCGLPNGGCSQAFQFGTLFASANGAAGSVTNAAIAAYYQANGGPAGSLGYPETKTITVPAASNGGGVVVGFQGGLVESSTAGTFVLKGAMREAHGAQGGVAGALGWPIAEQVCGLPNGGCSQAFQFGTLFASANGAAGSVTNPAIAAYYQAKGGPAGPLGYPETKTYVVPASANGGGVQVGFRGGLVESSSAGTFLLTGAIRDAHGRQGGVAGPLGWPTAEQVCGLPNGGCSQTFQFGTLFASNGASGAVTNAAIATYYQAKGGPGGSLGYPETGTITVPASANGGGVVVGFQGGIVESSPAGTFLVTGAMREAHGRQGGVGGSLGWPTAEQVCVPGGGCSQTFQNGTLTAG